MHPFKTRMQSINVYIVELTEGQEKVEEFDASLLKSKMMESMKLSITREQTLRKTLKANTKYVIIPTQKMSGVEGEFYLSIYFDTPLFSIDVRRLNDPADQFQYIPEEYEKGDKVVPEWKKKVIMNSMDHLIGGSRVGADTKSKKIAGDKKKAKKAQNKKARAKAGGSPTTSPKK